jgi:exopolysaccharide production protein ExoQ
VRRVFAIFIPQAISLRLTLATLWASATLLGLMCLPSLPAAIKSGVPMLGIFASKNANASSAEFWCFFSVYMVLERGRPAWIRLIAVATALIAIAFIQYSRAAGSAVSVGVFFVLTLVGVAYAGIPGRFRSLVLISGIPLVLAAIVAAPDILAAWQDFQTNVLQKDSTLTGRTFIWDVAARVHRDYPIWGVGYEAFWTHGNLYAEGIWRHFKNDFRGGFNFHNVFIEFKVALGQVGFVSIIALYGYVGLFLIQSWLTHKSYVRVFLFAYFVSVYLHSFSEVAMGSPFSVPTVLWMATPSFLILLKQNVGRKPAEA